VNTPTLFDNPTQDAKGATTPAGIHQGRAQIVPRSFIWATLVLIVLVCAMVLSAVSLVNRTPTWWRPMDVSDSRVRDLAEQVERAVVSTVHRHRPLDEPWTVAVSVEQANAWLNIKLPQWIANRSAQWPERIEELQMHFSEDATLSLGARIRGNDTSRVVVATIRPEVAQDGSLWLPMDAAQAGRLDLPRDWTVDQLREWIPEEVSERVPTDQLLDALGALAPMFHEPVLKLDDGRRVRLLAMYPDGERLLLTCVTEPRPVFVEHTDDSE
jgi:hypothetical protein